MPRSLRSLAPLLALAALASAPCPAAAVTFVDSGASLLGAAGSAIRSATAWGDFDGDGDLDLVVAGSTTGMVAGNRTRLYRNEGGGFVSVPTTLPNLGNAALAWGDHDRDGDLDLALSGVDSTAVRRTRVYRNDGGGAFADLGASLTALASGALAWGDYDRDGDLDLAACGTSSGNLSGATAKVYRNDDGTFVDASSGIAGGGFMGAIAFGDLDGDGDLDLLVTGYGTSGAPTTRVYRNDAGTWVAIPSSLAGVAEGAALCLADADGDGDLDLALAGSTTGDEADGTVRVYANDGTGGFTDLGASLTGLSSVAASWGDFDADGDVDLLLAGDNSTGSRLTSVARNDGGGVFTQVSIGVAHVGEGAIAWGDYDNDGRLDLAMTGRDGSGLRLARIYRNIDAPVNAAPGTPTALTATRGAAGAETVAITFSWTAPSDDHTPQSGLSYELRVGTTPGGAEIMGSLSDGTSGFRRVPRAGGAGALESHTLVLPYGEYHWSVHAVDGGYRGGAFAAEQSIVVRPMQDLGLGLLGVSGTGASYATPLAWGDYDHDGQLDLLVAGQPNTGNPFTMKTRLYRNVGGSLVPVPTALPNITSGGAAWGDYDRDGDLDLAMGSYDSTITPILEVMRNDGGGVFTDAGAGLPGLGVAVVAWGDYDRDGDLDLFVAGAPAGGGASTVARIYRNVGGTFTDLQAGLTGVATGAAAWGDLDGDGDLDLVKSGFTPGGTSPRTFVCINQAGAFTEDSTMVVGVTQGSIDLGDHDADGDLDLLICGSTTSGFAVPTTQLYDNDGTGHFTLQPAGLPDLYRGAARWGDYDGDGDLDIALTGAPANLGDPALARIARNDGGGVFQVLDVGLPGLAGGALAWGDLDGDGRLELAITGGEGADVFTRIYGHAGSLANTPPSPPSGLRSTGSPPGTAVLRWDPASDSRTAAAGLSYDVRVGTSTHGGQVVSLPADSLSGLRRVAQRGNAQADSCVIDLPGGVFYFTVQAIDASFAGSALPAWQTIVAGTLAADPVGDAPVALAIHSISPNPVRHMARVAFDLPREVEVDLGVYDVTGRRVATLLRARFAAGRQLAAWDGRGDHGERLPAGQYLVRLRAGTQDVVRRVTLTH